MKMMKMMKMMNLKKDDEDDDDGYDEFDKDCESDEEDEDDDDDDDDEDDEDGGDDVSVYTFAIFENQERQVSVFSCLAKITFKQFRGVVPEPRLPTPQKDDEVDDDEEPAPPKTPLFMKNILKNP